MGRFTDKVKSVLKRPKRSKAAQRAYDRWEGEGGALPPPRDAADSASTSESKPSTDSKE